MIKDELITFETAVLAKEKGFDADVYRYYDSPNGDADFGDFEYPENYNGYEDYYSAPTQSLLQRWLREVHGIDVWAFPIKDLTFKSGKSYTYLILDAEPPKLKMLYATYELALESALLEGLKLIKL